MKRAKKTQILVALMIGLMAVRGAVADAGASAADADQVRQLREALARLQSDFERVVREQQAQIQRLQQQLDALQAAASSAPAAEGLAAPAPTAATATAGLADANLTRRAWSPTDPIRIGRAGAYADLGLVATVAAGGSTAHDIEGGTQLGGHDPNQRGFTLQGVEMNLQGAVDPYFRGNANLLFSVDAGGDSFLEVEEAWMETVSLPANLQLRAGQILTDFGRINAQHPHQWAFVDSPLPVARLLGPDGLRNPGARLGWLLPVPFFAELSLCIQNSHGETMSPFRSGAGHHHGAAAANEVPFGYRHADNDRGVRRPTDLLFAPRLALSFDLTDEHTLLLGGSAAFGPNASGDQGDTRTQVYGLDAYWKWKPARAHGGFPFVSWQIEALLRRYELGAFDWDENGNGIVDAGELADPATGLPAVLGRETVTDWGFYTQWLYGFRKGWVAGLRFDFVCGQRATYERRGLTFDGEPLGRDPHRNQRWRLSPNLTWYPTEFSKLRLQYNYDERRGIGVDHSIWLQAEFVLGAHAAHKF